MSEPSARYRANWQDEIASAALGGWLSGGVPVLLCYRVLVSRPPARAPAAPAAERL